MYELKKIGKVFTSKFVEIGPSFYKKKYLPGRGLTKVEKNWYRQPSRLEFEGQPSAVYSVRNKLTCSCWRQAAQLVTVISAFTAMPCGLRLAGKHRSRYFRVCAFLTRRKIHKTDANTINMMVIINNLVYFTVSSNMHLPSFRSADGRIVLRC